MPNNTEIFLRLALQRLGPDRLREILPELEYKNGLRLTNENEPKDPQGFTERLIAACQDGYSGLFAIIEEGFNRQFMQQAFFYLLEDPASKVSGKFGRLKVGQLSENISCLFSGEEKNRCRNVLLSVNCLLPFHQIKDGGEFRVKITVPVPVLVSLFRDKLVVRVLSVKPDNWSFILGERVSDGSTRVSYKRIVKDVCQALAHNVDITAEIPLNFSKQTSVLMKNHGVATYEGEYETLKNGEPELFTKYRTPHRPAGDGVRAGLRDAHPAKFKKLSTAKVLKSFACRVEKPCHSAPEGATFNCQPYVGTGIFRAWSEGGGLNGFLDFITT